MARRFPPAVRHLLAHRTVTVIAAVTALLTAALTAAAVSFLFQVTASAAARELSGKPSSVLTVTAPVSRQGATRISGQIEAAVGRLLTGLRPRIDVSSQSDPLNVPVRPGPKRPRSRLQTQLVTLPGFSAHADMVSGGCRLTAGGAGGLPACVPAAVARELGVRTGTVLTLRDSAGGRPVLVRITGLFRPVSPRSPYWQLDPLGAG